MRRIEFTPLTQTILSDPEKGIHGNCFASCVSSITGIEDVPNFAQAGDQWFVGFWDWCDKNGWDGCSASSKLTPPGILIATGQGPRGFKHSVLWAGGAEGMVVWDPHPDRTGLIGRPENWISLEREKDYEPRWDCANGDCECTKHLRGQDGKP